MSKDFELLNNFERSDSLCSPSPQRKLLSSFEERNYDRFVEVLKNGVRSGRVDVNHFYDAPENGTLLDVICRTKANSKFVDILLQYSADINRINNVFNKAPIHFAVENSDTETLQVLLHNRNCDVNILDAGGNTALHIAAKLNKVSFVEIILKHPAVEINKINRKKQTPLHLALAQGSTEVVPLFLANLDIDLDDQKDFRDRTCRDIISEKYPNLKMELPRMKQGNDSNKSLFSFLYDRDTKSFIKLAKVNRHSLNESDGSGTYLQHACASGLNDIVSTLLQLGVDPNQRCPRNEKTPIMIAAENGYHKVLLTLLKHENTSFEPIMNKTVLHAAFDGFFYNELNSGDKDCDHRKCLEYILKEAPVNGLDINFPDSAGNTALHYAVKLNDGELVKSLLDAGAYVGQKNAFGEIPLKSISSSVLEEYLDSCISTNDLTSRQPEYQIIFDYKMLTPPKKQISYDKQQTIEVGRKDIYEIVSETEPMLVMNEVPELRKLLNHPVLTSFLNLKWYTIRKYFYVNLIFYVAFWLALTSYILYTFGSTDKNSTVPDATDTTTFEMFVPQNDTMLWCLTTLLCGVLFIREFFQFSVSPWPYLRSPENWLEMSLIGITTAVLMCQTSLDLRPQLAAVAILVSWMELILLIGRHPLLSTNIEMFKTVTINFLKFLAWYSILILAFAFSFFILFKDSTSEDEKFFRNPAMSVFKSVIMLTGEFDAGSIPFGDKLSTSHLLFVLFVFLIAIVLFNLLNGLAVSDTQAIRADAELVGIVSRVKLISYIESMAIGDPFPCLNFLEKLACCCCCVPVRQTALKRQKHVEMLYKRITLFPSTLPENKIRVKPNDDNLILLAGDSSSKFDDDSCFKRCAWKIDPMIIKETLKILEKRERQIENNNFNELIKEYSQQLHEYKSKLENVESAAERNEKLLKELLSVVKQRL